MRYADEERTRFRPRKEGGLLVVLVLDKLDDDVLLGLDLEHLQDETHERGWLPVPAVGASEVVELHSLVDEGLCREPETLLLPVRILVNLRAEDLLHQILRVRPVDALRRRVRTVRHHTPAAETPSPRLPSSPVFPRKRTVCVRERERTVAEELGRAPGGRADPPPVGQKRGALTDRSGMTRME